MTTDTEIALSVHVELDRKVDEASATDLRARWDHGQVLLLERNGGGRLPNQRLQEIIDAIGKSRRELSYRMQFAAEFPTEEQLCNAVAQFDSWHAYCNRPKGARLPVDPPELPIGLYATITADPPWQYGNTSTRGAAEDYYPTLSVEELCALNVDGRFVYECAGGNAHLYLWTTNGFLREAFDVLDAWGIRPWEEKRPYGPKQEMMPW